MVTKVKAPLVEVEIGGTTTNLSAYLNSLDVDDYTALIALSGVDLIDGRTINVTGSGIAGRGNLRYSLAHGYTSVRGVIVRITDDWYWERDVDVTYDPMWWELTLNIATSDTTAAAANTLSLKECRDFLATTGGTISLPLGDIVIAKDSTTVAKDLFNGIGCAFELVSWVSVVGQGAATIGGAEAGSRFTLADGQECDVLGNYDSTVAGLSGCWMDAFTVKGNRAGNLTTGNGITIGSIFTATGFGVIKVGDTRQRGVNIEATSTPIWIAGGVFCGATGEEGFYMNGASSASINLSNVQCDNADLNATGVAGLKVEVGSTENTNVTLNNYRYEQNATAYPTAGDVGIILDDLAGATVTIINAYGFSNDASATDFIKITGSTGRVNIVGTTANSNYTNVLNDVVSGRVIAQSTSGIPALFETLSDWNGVIHRSKSSGSVTVNKQNASGAFEINNPANGSTSNDVDIYGPAGTVKVRIDDSTSTGTSRSRVQADSILMNPVSGTGALILSGPGSPEGRGDATAPIGSLYLRNDGGAGTSIYVKESGTGNTGWVAK